jgi:glycosyltransferase 2 family protein
LPENKYPFLIDYKTIIGIILSIGGLYWAFHDFDFQSFLSSLENTNYVLIGIACISISVSVWFRAIRWRLLINSDDITVKDLYKIEMVGYFGNNVLPLRAGEIYRGVLLSQKTNLSKSYCLGTIALERMTDMVGLISLFGLLVLFYPLPAELTLWGNRIILSSLFVIGFIVLFKSYFKKVTFFNLKFLDQFINGITTIDFKKSIVVLGWTLVIWFVYWFDTYLIQYAFNLQMSWEQTLLVLILTSLAMAIPSAPGMIGTFHAAVKFTMVNMLGFEVDISDAFSIILHAYGFLALTGIGAYYFINTFKKD